MGRSEHFIQDIWGVVLQIGDTHIPTLIMGVSAFAIMWGLKKYAPKMPGVLIPVTPTTLASWAIGFEKSGTGTADQIQNPDIQILVSDISRADNEADALQQKIAAKQKN